MGERSHGSAKRVVFLVVQGVLEEVALDDLVFTVIAIGLVGVEVDLPEKPVELGLECYREDKGVGRHFCAVARLTFSRGA